MKKTKSAESKNDFQQEILHIMQTNNFSEEDIASKLRIRALTVRRWALGTSKPRSRIVLLAYEEFKKTLQQQEKI